MTRFRLLPATAAMAATMTAGLALALTNARADDTPSPCAALKRIVAAAPQGFQSLGSDEGRAVAQPYGDNGDDVRCTPSRAAYRCEWTPRDAGSSAAALQGVGADIASCLPDATHDQNSPTRQHFYLGARGDRTEITAAAAGASRVTLTVSKP